MRSRRAVVLRVAVRVLAVLALLGVCAALGNALLARNRAAEREAAGAASTFTPPAISSAQPKLVSVIADQTAGAEPGSDAAAAGPPSWISIVPKNVSIRLSPFVYPNSGYTVRGLSGDLNGSTFGTRAAQISDTTALTIFMGGAADQAKSQVSVAKAASKALATAHAAAPRSALVVVGPVWPTAYPPEGVLAVRDALRSAARVADATWVDPIASGWLAEDANLWNASSEQPTAAGQRRLGTLMTTVVKKALA